MRTEEPFLLDDLDQLAALLGMGGAVIPMCEVADGVTDPFYIGMRHDVDNMLEPAVDMAVWEAGRGWRSTYFILHTAPYWNDKPALERALDTIAGLGHEIGLHINAITEAIWTGRDPLAILDDALDELRGYGHPIRGVVAHGDSACHTHGFVNDELFLESPRPSYGLPDREIAGVKLRPVSRLELGLDYDPNWLPRGDYLSDSGGRWSQPFEEVAERHAEFLKQLHILIHPCWWRKALKGIGALA